MFNLMSRSFKLFNLNKVVRTVNVNYLYNESAFGLNHFIELKKLKEKELDLEFRRKLKEKLANTLTKQNVDELNIKEINDFLILANDTSDQDLACDVFKLYLKENYLIDDKNFGELLIKNDYLINKSCEKAIELLNDKYIQPSLMTQITTFALMIKFYNTQNHEQIYDCFIKYTNHLEKQQQTELKPLKFRIKSQRQQIPFGHLRLVTASLLIQNSNESLEKMKKIIELASKFNSHLNNTSLASCFLLALNRNDLETAKQMLSRITTRNKTLKLNLEAILNCYANDFNLAVNAIESIIRLSPNQSDAFHGKLFNHTLNSFKQLLARTNNETNNKLIIKMNSKLFKLDLFEYCTLIHSKFNK